MCVCVCVCVCVCAMSTSSIKKRDEQVIKKIDRRPQSTSSQRKVFLFVIEKKKKRVQKGDKSSPINLTGHRTHSDSHSIYLI